MTALLIDTDAFCKLGATNLLMRFIESQGVNPERCYRLPRLVPMLKSTLRPTWGGPTCDRLVFLADRFPKIPQVASSWTEAMRGVHKIDPGELQLFALAAEHRHAVLLTDDKHSLQAIERVPGLGDALEGRVATVGAALLRLGATLGEDEVHACVAPERERDAALAADFALPPKAALLAVEQRQDRLQRGLPHLRLWR